MSELIFNNGRSSSTEPPKIEFPCDYPIKVIGDNDDDFMALVVDIICRHDASFKASTASTRPSKNGNFQSITASITATGKEQLAALHNELKATGRVKMVL